MIRLIAAIDMKRGIAKNGSQPWHIPEDERYFQQSTISHGGVVLMGRHTFETLKKPLPERRNLVLSRSPYGAEGVVTVTDLPKLLLDFKKGQDIWVIGGAEIYEQTLSQADELYITKITADFDCDQFFPSYESSFQRTYQSEEKDYKGLKYSFAGYRKTNNG